MNDKPLIAHVLYRLDTGGMEMVMVSLINATGDRYRHAVICLDGFSSFRERIEVPNVPCLALNKKPGKDWRCYFRLWKALRTLKPDLVQTYNIGTMDLAPVAKLAGVRRVVHAEHGRDAADPAGERHRRLRHWVAPFIDRHIVVSRELEAWLIRRVGIASSSVSYIPNGIDIAAFERQRNRTGPRRKFGNLAPAGTVLITNVARLDKVKDHAGLLLAFKQLRDTAQPPAADCRLAIIGDGPERDALERQIDQFGLAESVHLLGERSDVPELLAECDLFALSSIAEGIPITVLEAMAAGLPVVATDVGGIADVVVDGDTGTLVPPSDPAALAGAIQSYVRDRGLRRRHGDAGRVRVEARFSLPAMVSAYTALYDALLPARPRSHAPNPRLGRIQRREP